jgi:FKBP-type peptidyl-prolyl cis-trans isomerase
MNAKRLALAAVAAVLAAACADVSGSGNFQCETEAPEVTSTRADTAVTDIGLRYLRRRAPTDSTSRPVDACDVVSVQYRAFLRTDTVVPFDSTGTAPIRYVAGGGQLVVPGLDVGVIGMRTGEVRRLFIPGELGFGLAEVTYRGRTIPANSPLIFDVTLLGITHRDDD